MESAHIQYLFSLCDELKKSIIPCTHWFVFFDALQPVNKICLCALSME